MDLETSTKRLTERTQGVLTRIEELCKQRPWAAIMLGLGVGALLRGLLSRR